MNRLSKETSPYLLQHAHNPVDWYPWGTEALDKARRDNLPIFLSIGYSACHWCHVMEKESFEDQATADILNARFLSIKVDREERPDLDHIYMSAVQMLTQHGGWPMSVFLTPDLKPFYGGTYFPPEDRMGMPSFKKVLLGVANAWATKKEEVVQSAQKITDALKEVQQQEGDDTALPPVREGFAEVYKKITRNFDTANGGFGTQPKFFHTMDVRVCLREAQLNANPSANFIATHTLNKWAGGGIYDHLAGGFHRYSTDAAWLVPHFEKMLYDNALVTETFLEAYQVTKDSNYLRVANETLDYVLRQMTSPEGGFYSTEDADSEGVEGKFYVWKKSEIEDILDPELAALFCKVYDVTEEGNWEENSILNLPRPMTELVKESGRDATEIEDSLGVARRKLLQARATRIAPFRDEKILTGWNGMMIHTFALGYQVCDDSRYLEAAQNAATLILTKMKIKDDRTGTPLLLHSYKDGRARLAGYLDDYAHLTNALVSLYESDFDVKWLQAAKEHADLMVSEFWDDKDGFHYTARNHEALVLRPKEHHDGATPSAVGVALTALTRLGRLTSSEAYLKIAERELKRYAKQMTGIPQASGQMWIAYDLLAGTPIEIVCAGPLEESAPGLKVVRGAFLPGKIVAREGSGLPLTEGKVALSGEPTFYVCRNHTCKAPVTKLADLEKELSACQGS